MPSRGVNKVIIIGNLGQDPEVRYMPNGKPVANLSVATSESWKDKNTGEQQERTEWHRVVAFGKLAEIIEKWVTKGTKVYCEGKLQTRSWEQDGTKRYSTEVIVDHLQMLGGGQQRSQAPAQSRHQEQKANGYQPQQSGGDTFQDDIPFAPYQRSACYVV